MAIPGFANIQVAGMFDEEFTMVNATAQATPLLDGTYSLELVLVADGLKGTGSAWNQANYYYQYTALEVPEDLAIFAKGGTYGKSSITGWTFNDVAIASSYANSTNKIAKQTLLSGELGEFAYTLSLPTKVNLKNALQKDQVYVVAILVDSDGKIANAVKAKVKDFEPTAISDIHSANACEAVRYTLDGRQITAPQHGVNIVRMSDGTVRKVMVK